MNPVIRGLAVYIFVLIVFRILGKRSLSEITTFDFVLLLIISETTTDALIGQDYSLIACFVMVSTLVTVDYLFSLLKDKSKSFQVISEGAPLIIVDHGKPLVTRMKKTRVDEDDVMEAARLLHGLERLDQIKYAVLERDGSISIIPVSKSGE
jgi:uncharacterized membrane protein YcaP (DUF421 family)